MIKRSDVVIIIPHFGGSKESEYAYEQCILSLNETVPDVKKIVVKNGAKCMHEGNLRIETQGQNAAVNLGVSIAKTPWVMVTNDDMIYSPGWFERISSFLGGDVLCISPKLIEPNQQHAPTFDYYFCGGAGGDFDKTKWLEFAKGVMEKPEGASISASLRTGFNLPFLIRKDIWDTIGGYDENYDPWGSNGDSDLEYKIRLAGVQPYQDIRCVVYHFSQTSGTGNPENRPYWAKNWDYFISKWGFPRTDDGIWEANFLMPKLPVRVFVPEWEKKYETT